MSKLLKGATVPDITLTDLQNERVALSSLRGTPVLLNFFTSNCTWCRSEMMNLAEVYRRVENMPVVIMGVCVGQDAATAAQFAAEQQLDIPVFTDDGGQSQTLFQLERVPTLILLDAEGKVACIYEGATEQLAGIVEQTILAIANNQQLPEYSLVGNGCGFEN